ncbi:MAG TPA: phenylalanine--tRNA ligase subunit beta, partial [Castellaniella sp.]|nr:phenylalanine--tRNA ligase subunit beta [Castellaniella sp.]
MQFPESWLRTWANPDIDSQALAHRLTMAGLEVEDADPYAPAFSGVVAARIEAVENHPNADKLHVCRVNDGSGEPLQIVCGAPNAAAGLVVPLARIGAELPGGVRIAPVKMRGVISNGM